MEAIGSRFPVLVYEKEGEVLGYAYLAPAFERRAFSWDCDLSVYVRRDARGGGIGTKLEGAAAELPEALFKQGRWMSLIWLEKEVNGAECAASFPRPLSALPAHIWEEL